MMDTDFDEHGFLEALVGDVESQQLDVFLDDVRLVLEAVVEADARELATVERFGFDSVLELQIAG